MATFTSISSLADLLGYSYNGAAYKYDLSKIADIMMRDLESYNTQVNEIVGSMAMKTENQKMVFDGVYTGSMEKMGEIGKPRTKDEKHRWEVGFPVYKFGHGIGFTWNFLQTATAAEIDKKFKGLQVAHQRAILREYKKAIFNNTNFTVYDSLLDNAELGVKRFWNNDGTTPPANTSGTTFASTHTHYLANTSGSVVANADVDGLISTVTEHDNANVQIVINISDVETMKGLSKFTALQSPLMVPASTSETTVQKLNLGSLDNRVIGIWDGTVPVVTRPWAVDNYWLCIAENEDPKAVAMRELPNPAMRGLIMNETKDGLSIVTEEAVSFFGFGIANRSAGAVLYTGNSTWTNPTIS